MKHRVLLILKTFLSYTVLFVLFKPLFMIYNHSLYSDASVSDYFNVMIHGLSMDMSVAGYFTGIPALITIVSVWLGKKQRTIRISQQIYFIIISFIISMIYIIDMVLYGYWGFRLDTTPLFYFFSSPGDAIASVSIWFVILGVVVLAILSVSLCLYSRRILIPKLQPVISLSDKCKTTVVLIFCTALLILPIRGSVTTSTMNLGYAYFSDNQRLNHAAINPIFSLLSSSLDGMNTGKQYRFMSSDEADKLFADMVDTTSVPSLNDSSSLFTTTRPNVIVVVLESFSAKIMDSMGGIPGVAVNMDKYSREGVFFNNFYANSFRTDRGLASIIAAYPAQPTMSIMKYPNKTGSLPMFPQVLSKAGYNLKYYYGGDADFTNMRSFLTTAGFEQIVSDEDFPIKLKLSKWGVPDQYVFDKALADLKMPYSHPFLKIIQTSSSHEPFDVPYHKLKNKRLNAFAYTDNCLGRFIDGLKKTPNWKNTVIIMVPDHLGSYPENIDNYRFDRYHIPLIIIGGAVKSPRIVSTYGSQIDITATLLAQMKLPYRKFRFSKDMMNSRVPHFAFSTVPNAFAFISAEDSVMYNCESKKVITDCGVKRGSRLKYGQAYLQKLYDDISKR